MMFPNTYECNLHRVRFTLSEHMVASDLDGGSDINLRVEANDLQAAGDLLADPTGLLCF